MTAVPRCLVVALACAAGLVPVATATPAAAPAVPGATVASHPGPVALRRVPGHDDRPEMTSTNWSGYAVEGPGATSASGTWDVPAVNPTAASSFSSTWVGIDGVGNGTLIQAGTEQDASGGTSLYSAWWETYPAPAVPLTMTVRPGDQMHVALAEVSHGTWSITVTDATSGASWSHDESYDGPGDSAEWIEESPQVAGSLTTLAPFHPVTFSDARLNGADPGLTAADVVDQVSPSGRILAVPSPPVASGDGFTDYYSAANVAPGRPGAVTATAGYGRVTLHWTPPTDGGPPVRSWTVTVTSGGRILAIVVDPDPADRYTVTGLATGVGYQFTVAATNIVGTGPATAPSRTVRPLRFTRPVGNPFATGGS